MLLSIQEQCSLRNAIEQNEIKKITADIQLLIRYYSFIRYLSLESNSLRYVIALLYQVAARLPRWLIVPDD